MEACHNDHQVPSRVPGFFRHLSISGMFFFLCLMYSAVANAGYFELSSGFSFNKTDYGSGNFSWTRRYGANFGYNFWDTSEIELSFQDSVVRTMITGYEDTTFHDQVYSLNWVQSLAPKDSLFQPFIKAGIGQLNRDASGMYYALGVAPPSTEDTVTGILGAGLKIHLTRSFGLRGEATSYLTNGRISTWKDNIGVTAGLSFYF
jgi:hypothetical protein